MNRIRDYLVVLAVPVLMLAASGLAEAAAWLADVLSS